LTINDLNLTDAQPTSTPPYTMDPHTSKHTVNASSTLLKRSSPNSDNMFTCAAPPATKYYNPGPQR